MNLESVNLVFIINDSYLFIHIEPRISVNQQFEYLELKLLKITFFILQLLTIIYVPCYEHAQFNALPSKRFLKNCNSDKCPQILGE